MILLVVLTAERVRQRVADMVIDLFIVASAKAAISAGHLRMVGKPLQLTLDERQGFLKALRFQNKQFMGVRDILVKIDRILITIALGA